MNNLEYWNKLSTPPQAALKKIVAGRMKGKSDINPQWRIKAMTEVFGPVGIGWKYSIDRLWTEKGGGDLVCAFALVSVCIKHDGEWSDPVPGSGGSMLIAQEKNGPFTSDEAFKMATTDALSVALKAIGVAADVYMGIFDGAKYPTSEVNEDASNGNADNRTKVETALSWIDKHIESSTSASLRAGWDQHFIPRLKEFTAEHQNELTIAYKDTIGLLIEQESKS